MDSVKLLGALTAVRGACQLIWWKLESKEGGAAQVENALFSQAEAQGCVVLGRVCDMGRFS